MIRINGHWETTDSLKDIARIIREYYNEELANELDELIIMHQDEVSELRLQLYNAVTWDYDDDEWCGD